MMCAPKGSGPDKLLILSDSVHADELCSDRECIPECMPEGACEVLDL
jgi:hypothetical protein